MGLVFYLNANSPIVAIPLIIEMSVNHQRVSAQIYTEFCMELSMIKLKFFLLIITFYKKIELQFF